MHFRVLSIILFVFSCHAATEAYSEPPQGVWPTIKQKLDSVCHTVKRSAVYCALAAKKLVLKGIRWTWRKKIDIAAATVLNAAEKAINKYWPSPEQAQITSKKENIEKISTRTYLQALNCGAAGLKSATYVNYKNCDGHERRCYPERQPKKFEELAEQFEGISENTSREILYENGQEHVDAKIFFRTMSEEASLNILQSITAKILAATVKLPDIPGPVLFKCFVRGFCYVAVREALRHNFVRPCMNFGVRVTRDGLQNALRSVWA